MVMGNPYKQLVTLFDARMEGKAANAISGVPCELGTITPSGLKLDSFKHEIKDYLVADWLMKIHFPAFTLIGTATWPVDENGIPLPDAKSTSARFDFKAEKVDQVHLELKADIKSGDRVLVIQVNGGQDAVIIGKVVS